MKKIQRKSSSLSLETIKQIHTLAEELKLNLNEQNKIDSYFNIPENVYPYSVIVLGYPTEDYTGTDRFDEDRIHYESY